MVDLLRSMYKVNDHFFEALYKKEINYSKSERKSIEEFVQNIPRDFN